MNPRENPDKQVSVSAVMFSYNEAQHLESVVKDAIAELSSLVTDFELILVDDGSTDETPEILQALSVEHPVLKVIRHDQNRGIGEAVHTGYAAASCDYVCILPADGQITVEQLGRMIPFAMSGSDLILGRYAQRGEVDGLFRMFLSRGLRMLIWLLVGVSRRIDSAFMFRRTLLNEFPLKTRSFFVNLELPIRVIRGDYRIDEIEITVQPRISGQSKVVRFDRIALVLKDLLKLRLSLWYEAFADSPEK